MGPCPGVPAALIASAPGTPVLSSTAWFVTIRGLLDYEDGVLLFGVCGHCLGLDAKRGCIFDPTSRDARNISVFSTEGELADFLLPRGFPWFGTTVLQVLQVE